MRSKVLLLSTLKLLLYLLVLVVKLHDTSGLLKILQMVEDQLEQVKVPVFIDLQQY